MTPRVIRNGQALLARTLTVSTTQIYAHLVPSDTQEAAAILDKLAAKAEVIQLAGRRVA